MNRSTPGLPVHHHLREFTQTHVHWVRDAIQPSHPGSSPSPPAPNPSQHQSLFQWVNSSHEVSEVRQVGGGETLQETDTLEENMPAPTQLLPGSLRWKWKPLEKLFYESSGILSCSLTSTSRNSLHWDALSCLTAFVFMIVLFHFYAFFFLWGSPSFILPMGFLLWDANTVLSCLDISKLTAWNFFLLLGKN